MNKQTKDLLNRIKLKHDNKINIAIGHSRKETDWKNREMLWSQFVARLSQTTRTSETVEEFTKMPKSQQDGIKDVGGFVGGTLKGGRRTVSNVGWRQVLTLDADFAKNTQEFIDTVDLMFGDGSYVIYSTHKHRPEKPRLRLVVPLIRPVVPDEYQAIGRRVAADIDMDLFDDTTYQPHRLMYWPSTSVDGEFIFHYQDGPWLDPDEVLARYPDWRDQSFWPESSRVHKARKRQADKQGDPLQKQGLVGAFCRTYSITEAIEAFLSDVYEPCETEGRYTYIPGSSNGGMVIYEDDKFAFSHHGTDPICEKLVNAFDLVRLHKFGEQDEDAEPGTPTGKLPSYKAMLDFIMGDPKVKITIGKEKLAEAQTEFEIVADPNDESWMAKMEVNRYGQYVSSPKNILLIMEHDPEIAGKIALNDLSHRTVVLKNLPWRNHDLGEFWGDRDDSGLRNYLSSCYGIKGQGIITDALNEILIRHHFHPIRDYLEGLWWDGEKRMETLLIDYLGAADTPYVRAVTRKMLIAAVARVMQPGIKFDYVLVTVGPQGVGKSYILKKLGQKWFSDSLTTVQGKEAYEQLQGAWLIELGELSATKKAETEAVKHFISKQEDAFRVAYGRQISVFPRQCVFFGTTNDDLFLRDKTGNRRFWPVEVGVQQRKKSLWADMDQFVIDQLWAEAATAWHEGEALKLEDDLEREALKMQERHMEESEKFGQVQEYLERLLPEDWDQRDISTRRAFLQSDFGEAEGTIQRTRVCTLEIWVELFGGDPKNLTVGQSREINDILKRMPNWKPYKDGSGKLRFGNLYGLQRAFIRND